MSAEPAVWDERRARAAIDAIVADAERAWDGVRFPFHPADEVDDGPNGLYLGTAGVVWALVELGRGGWEEAARTALERYGAKPDMGEHASAPAYLTGECGIALTAFRLTRDPALADRVQELVLAGAGTSAHDVLSGAPGSLLAAEAMLAWTGEERWDDAWQFVAERVLAARDPDGLWTQDLFGREARCIGAAHGFVGNVRALRNRGAEVDGVDDVLHRYALLDERGVNWPPTPDSPPDGLRIQWCHGAPGVLTSLGTEMEEELALAAGELVWRTGPLAKGPGLCHGTAGNGYAFLALHERTGDPVWLDRARAFAMHALAQVEAARAEHGRGRYSLLTGDVGVALYLRDCLAGRGDFPLLGPFA